MGKRFAVILAAGQGTRMKSKLYKVLHPVVGRPMVQHVIDQLENVQLDHLTTVVGFGAEEVIEKIGERSEFVIQEEQLGTGHAVEQAESVLADKEGTTIIVCGDTPLITSETFEALFDYHEKEGSKATILTAKAPNPTGYGRVIRNEKNQVERIVEHKDANAVEREVNEINTGTYCFDNQSLFRALKEVSNDNAQGEYYLPDVIEIIKEEAGKVSAFMTPEFEETIGINDRLALAEAERLMKHRINKKHMQAGVTIIDPANTYIGLNVKIEQDVLLHPNTTLTGNTIIREDAEICSHSEINNSVVGKSSIIKNSVITDSEIGRRVIVGPYANIRPGTVVGTDVKIGHFVELKESIIGDESKIPHLSYIGDAKIGNQVNVGCGTITVNYDGNNKYETNIKDGAFIGCNSNLVAPVTIGEEAYIGAGSTITKDVPEKSLSIARARQTNKVGYTTRVKKSEKK